MKTIYYKTKIEREREKLNRLVDKALKKGTPISETYEIMEQSRKLNDLILKNEKEKKL